MNLKISNLILLILLSLFIHCTDRNAENKDSQIICKCSNPTLELNWLKDFIAKAEIDKTGNYIGTIWLEKYNNEDVFVTDMAIGSGGVAFYVFDCEGKIVLENSSGELGKFLSEIKKNNIIYSNLRK